MFLAVLLILAVISAACDSKKPTSPASAAPTATFSPEAFRRAVLEKEPKGLAIRIQLPSGSSPGIESGQIEAAVRAAPDQAVHLTMTFQGKQEVRLEMIAVGQDLYMRGGLGDAPVEWMKTAATEVGGDLAKGLPGGNLEEFSAKALNSREWANLSDAPCGSQQCFLVESQDAEKMQILLNKSDYRPVKFIQKLQGEGRMQEVVVDVLSWDEEISIEPPAGEIREVTPSELGTALLGILIALGGMGG